MGVHDAGQSKVPNLQYQVIRVDKQVGRLEVTVQHIGRVDVLKASEKLVHEEPGVALWQKAPLQQLTQVSLHVLLHNVDWVHLCQGHHVLREPATVGAQCLKHLVTNNRDGSAVNVSFQIENEEIHWSSVDHLQFTLTMLSLSRRLMILISRRACFTLWGSVRIIFFTATRLSQSVSTAENTRPFPP